MSNGPLVKLSSAFIAKGVNVIIDAIERTDADAPLLLSPFFSQYGANPGIESAKIFWASFIRSVNFREQDIFCPQDAVGAGWTIEENLVNVWRMYSDAVKLSGKKNTPLGKRREFHKRRSKEQHHRHNNSARNREHAGCDRDARQAR